VIAVSKTTKKDLVKLYNVPEEKIEVVYNGFEKKINIESSNKYRVTTDTPYILYVGTLQPRKNINVLIQAFKKFLKNHSDYKLILVGKKGWMYERIFKEVGDLGLQKSVIFTGYLPDEDVVGLYKHAYCYVLPSLYEGFGIPLLEAMSHDCPVISSFAASLSEVGGDACIYFDPQNVDGLVDDLESLQKKDLRTDLIKKGREHIRLFSWEKCAKETLAILESVAQK
jgi:glycosyltransferase involved in cell wall biosynthesis